MPTSANSPRDGRRGALPVTSSRADSPASRPRRPRPSTVFVSGWAARTAASGSTCCGWCNWSGLAGWLWRTWPAVSSGRRKSREVWRLLAIEFPEAREVCRLRLLALLIAGKDCSGLPTLTSRDWRSPGCPTHRRLSASRGEPLTETLGCRLSPDFCEWVMGFPEGWTDVSGSRPSATRSLRSRRST